MSGFFERMTQRAAGTEVRWQARPRAVFEPRSGPGPFVAPGPGDGTGGGDLWSAPGSSGSSGVPWAEERDGGRARGHDVRPGVRGGPRTGAAGSLDAAGGLARGASRWAAGERLAGEESGSEGPGGRFGRAFDREWPGRGGFDREGFGSDGRGPDELGGDDPGRGVTGSGPSGGDGPGRRGDGPDRREAGGEQQSGDRAAATRGSDRSGAAGAWEGPSAVVGPRGPVGRSRYPGAAAGRGGPAPDEGPRRAGRRADAARSDRQERDPRSRWSAQDRGDRTVATPGTDDAWASGDGWAVAPSGASDRGDGAGFVPADRPPAAAGDGTSAARAARGGGPVPEVADLLRDRLVPELRARGVIGAAERVDLRDGRGRALRPGATTLGWTAAGEAGGAPTTGRGGRPGSSAEAGGVHLHIDRVEVVRPVVEPRPAPALASGGREPSRLDAYLERRRTDRR